MALRQRSDNADETTRPLQDLGNRPPAPIRPCLETVWAIVFIFSCAARCGPDLSSPTSAAHRAYDVLVIRHSDTYHPRTYRGLLATDGKRHRVAFYWLDPTGQCDQMDALAFSDLLFCPDKVWFWHHKDPGERHVLPLGSSQAHQQVRFPTDYTPESILESILRLIVHNRTGPASHAGTMETARFFQGARQHDRFDHTVEQPASDEAAKGPLPESAKDDCTILNQLPFGRRYSKRADKKGNVVWRVSKAAVSMEKVTVTLRPRPLRDAPGWSEAFDPNTLGRWSAVPKPCRQYWSFRHQSRKLRRTPSVPEAQRLYADIDSCLRGSLPDDVELALHELRFTVSLETGSSEAMASSARQYFHAYIRLAREPVEKIVAELGHIAKGLGEKWPEDQTRDFVLPLLRPLVDPKVFNDPGFIRDDIFRRIRVRGPTRPLYGQLMLETIEEATSLDPEFLARLAAPFRDRNDAANVGDSDPSERISPKAPLEAENAP